MRLFETNHNRLLPEIGAPIDVTYGQVSRTTVTGKVVKRTATQVTVRYKPVKNTHEIEHTFWKKNGSRVGDGDFLWGPHVGLPQ